MRFWEWAQFCFFEAAILLSWEIYYIPHFWVKVFIVTHRSLFFYFFLKIQNRHHELAQEISSLLYLKEKNTTGMVWYEALKPNVICWMFFPCCFLFLFIYYFVFIILFSPSPLIAIPWHVPGLVMDSGLTLIILCTNL